MKTEKVIVPISVSAAVIVAAIAAIVVTNNRATVAREKAAEADALESVFTKSNNIVKLNRDIAAKNSEAARDAKAKADAEKETVIAAQKKSEADAAAEKLAKERAQAESEAARAQADAARDEKEAAKQKADAAKAVLDKENARIAGELALSNAAVAEATVKFETKKRETEAVIAEAKLRDLRKIEFEAWERDLIEFEQELKERERALHPDVSVYDSSNITWVAEREADVIGGETNRMPRAKRVLPENDPRLPAPTRELARAERIDYESRTNRVAESRAKIIATLERLRDEAVHDGRVLDVNFYQKSIKSFYPDYQDPRK